MFKSMLKRSWLSITRKLSRTIILTLILFVMANLMLATIAIKSAVGESIQYAKETLSGTVYLQADMTNLREQAMQDFDPSSGSGTRPTFISFERPTISIDMAKNLADSTYVKDYTYSIQSSANASNFTPVETEQQKMREEIRSRTESSSDSSTSLPTGPSGGGGGMEMRFEFNSGDITIQGINSFAFISDVEAGNMELSSGEIFDETTGTGVIISYDLANENDLALGDTIKLETTDEDEPVKHKLTIIGIYDTTTENYDPNTIYTNIDTAAQFLSEDQYDDGNYGVESVKYYLTSAEYKDAFIDEANQKYPNLADDGLAISIDDSAYQQMAGPIESVGSFATTILWIVIIASVVIITLMVTINIKDRRYEMGVLMSIGATKQNITGQILTELLLIGTVAFVLSIVPSAFIAKAMGNGLLDQQLSMNETSQSQNFGRGTNSGGMGGGRGDNMQGGGPSFDSTNAPSSVPSNMIQGDGNSSSAEVIDEIDVTPSPTDYLILFLAGYGVIIFALILPTINILRFEPKTILTGKE